ncbi:VOC family protein [Pedobacter sp. L105]|uniref:VOC family protein n=1 Tax=Pedobacter sp. L105 TaxID=1641871 RepID=UPI00131B6728|nr:VOC family protein [Pedobacter sp. L105]
MKNYKGQQTILPYLMLVNAAGFIEFIRMVFNAEILLLNLAEDNRTVLNAELKIGHTMILLSEALDQYGRAVGNFFIYVGNADETFNRAVYHGASVVSQVTEMDYGRCGGIEDPFGNTWWLTTA